jgi:hypothetical protein
MMDKIQKASNTNYSLIVYDNVCFTSRTLDFSGTGD